MPLSPRTLATLTIDDAHSFRHVALYRDLADILVRDAAVFHVAPPGSRASDWNRAVFLNLTFWSPTAQGDVLVSEHIPADVVAHVAWHHLAHRALGTPSGMSAHAMLLGESIASAFDLYLAGRLLGHAPDSDFLATQLPAMRDVAASAGADDTWFESVLAETAREPERAFEDLRQLLFDASTSLLHCNGNADAVERLARLDDHRLSPMLHHFELSNWILTARGAPDVDDTKARAVDAAMRAAPVALDWLEEHWVRAPV